MEPLHEEFDERELFDEEEAKLAGSDSEEESCEAAQHTPDTSLGMDFAGGQSGSHRSTTLNVVLEEESAAQESAAWEAASFKVQRTQPKNMAYSLPVSSGHIKMGSSVPINIPFLGGRMPRATAEAIGGEPQYPATFVPPHQISASRQNDYSFSMTGESPGAQIKRERLRVRNAILKSTGFLEGHPAVPAGPIALAGLSELGVAGELQQRHGSISKAAAVLGGLSQALGAVGSPAR